MHLPRRARVVLMLLFAAALAGGPAHAQIRRCVTGDGGHVYTDRECKDIGASERAPRQGIAEPGGRLIRRDCSRRLQDLVFELTAAIDTRDVNRLAGIYHWPGTSSRTAYAIMGRLDAIVNRPLVHITPLQPPPPTPLATAPPPAPLTWRTRPDAASMQTPSGGGGRSPTRADAALPESIQAAAMRNQRSRQVPTGLVLDQTVANRITPLQTVLSLRRHLGCWWVSL